MGTSGVTSCDAGPEPYEALGYTVVLTFSRGSSHVDLEFHLRNECSDLSFGPWTDQATRVASASFDLPLQLGADRTAFYGGSEAISSVTNPTGEVAVEQRAGAYAGAEWSRRAQVSVSGEPREAGEEVTRPFLVVSDGTNGAYGHIPWMRYREPQSIAVDGTRISLRFISESVIVGEARGIWNSARLGFVRAPDMAGLEEARGAAIAALERGLLVRPTRETLNAAAIFPTIGDDRPSALRAQYLELLTSRHEATINEQREDHNIYGSQIWPDIPFLSGDSPDPSIHSPKMNYWNASRTELLEFWRSGEAKWVWDWSMMQTWTQLFSAYANAGERSHGNRNGFALTSGGCGWSNSCCHFPPPAPADCPTAGEDESGHWHRSGQGSDDYTYTHGDVGYVIRPTYAMQRRFAHAGRTVIDRYPDAADAREIYVSERSIVRQVIQHWALLANCAEFVPGEEGQACDRHLRSIFEELARDNLSGGVLCMREDPDETIDPGTGVGEPANPQTCMVPQQFMQNALMLPFFYRVFMNYGDIGGQLRRGTVDSVFNYYAHGMAIPIAERPTREGDARPAIPTGDDAQWTNQLQYTLAADRSAVEACPPAPGDELIAYDESASAASPVPCVLNPASLSNFGEEAMLLPNRPQTVGWLAVAGAMDPTLRVCGVSRVALENESFLDLLGEYDTGEPDGWMKGPAQISQGLIFALGAYEACADQ